jgi:hypothetical protein
MLVNAPTHLISVQIQLLDHPDPVRNWRDAGVKPAVQRRRRRARLGLGFLPRRLRLPLLLLLLLRGPWRPLLPPHPRPRPANCVLSGIIVRRRPLHGRQVNGHRRRPPRPAPDHKRRPEFQEAGPEGFEATGGGRGVRRAAADVAGGWMGVRG